MLKISMKGSLVFKAAMSVFIPDLYAWEHATVDKLMTEMPDVISAIVSFIQVHHSDSIGFPRASVRGALIQKVSDARKKIRELRKSSFILRKYHVFILKFNFSLSF